MIPRLQFDSTTQIRANSGDVLAQCCAGRESVIHVIGAIVPWNYPLIIAAWNLVDPSPGILSKSHASTITLAIRNAPPSARAIIQRVDNEHGNVLPKYAAMGKPIYPTPTQVEQLNRETALSAPEETHLTSGQLALTLEPNALVLVKISSH